MCLLSFAATYRLCEMAMVLEKLLPSDAIGHDAMVGICIARKYQRPLRSLHGEAAAVDSSSSQDTYHRQPRGSFNSNLRKEAEKRVRLLRVKRMCVIAQDDDDVSKKWCDRG